MSQETEKEDPRQVPPKRYGGTQPGQSTGSGSKPGGMHDDLDDSRGATDRENAGDDTSRERSSGSGSRSGTGGSQQQDAQKSDKQDKSSSNRTGSGSSPPSGGSSSTDSKR